MIRRFSLLLMIVAVIFTFTVTTPTTKADECTYANNFCQPTNPEPHPSPLDGPYRVEWRDECISGVCHLVEYHVYGPSDPDALGPFDGGDWWNWIDGSLCAWC